MRAASFTGRCKTPTTWSYLQGGSTPQHPGAGLCLCHPVLALALTGRLTLRCLCRVVNVHVSTPSAHLSCSCVIKTSAA